VENTISTTGRCRLFDMDRSRVLAVARGDAPADLALDGGRVVNVFTHEILEQSVAVVDGLIAAVGEARDARERIDLGGRLLLPGLIDAHVHLESSMVVPSEFARAVVPRGTTTVVCDPHEVANVAGLDGVRWMLAASADLPLDVLVMAPSCVPATDLATSGARLTAADLATLAGEPRVLGLAEVMNIPGAVLGDPEVHAKLDTFAGRPVDGHGPGLGGRWLDAYIACGVGSDHECLRADEAMEKLRRGMRIFLRESTGAKNLINLLPAVTAATLPRCALCTDDRHPHDLLDDGHIDHLLRLTIEHGLDPVEAVCLATLSAADAFGLNDRGAVAPGRRADLVVCSDLGSFSAEMVFAGGRMVARDGRPIGDWPAVDPGGLWLPAAMAVDVDALAFRVPAAGSSYRVIGIVPGQIITEHLVEELLVEDGSALPDPDRDIVSLAVVERHHGSGNVGVGFVRGLGLEQGAIAGTVAHDHHNLVVAGCDETSMRTAAAAAAAMGGGLVAVDGERVLAQLPLPVAGLMSDRSLAEVRASLDDLVTAARKLGCTHPDPFMILSFLALEVIPALKLTDRGLVDVERFELVPVAVD
jgi:adenine deaminase